MRLQVICKQITPSCIIYRKKILLLQVNTSFGGPLNNDHQYPLKPNTAAIGLNLRSRPVTSLWMGGWPRVHSCLKTVHDCSLMQGWKYCRSSALSPDLKKLMRRDVAQGVVKKYIIIWLQPWTNAAIASYCRGCTNRDHEGKTNLPRQQSRSIQKNNT